VLQSGVKNEKEYNAKYFDSTITYSIGHLQCCSGLIVVMKVNLEWVLQFALWHDRGHTKRVVDLKNDCHLLRKTSVF
jgi:hypothetical protein